MAVRTRKSTSTLPSEPVPEPAAAAPTRRRVPGTRAATTRRPATSARTLRPIVPPEPTAEPVAGAPISEDPAAAAPVLSAWAVPEPPPEVAAEAAAVAPAIEAPAHTPSFEAAAVAAWAPAVPAEVLGVAAEVEIPAPQIPAEELAVAPAAALPLPEAPPPHPAAGLPLLVEQLQADVRVLQSLVTGHTEQTVQELGRTTMQMVRMVTGVAHHLDQLAEQVQQLSGVAHSLAQALTRVEGTVATLQTRTQEQMRLAAHGQRELQDVLSPVLSELVALRTQAARNTSMDRLDQFRREVELKQLRQSIEKHGAPPELGSALIKPSRARLKR